jgi:DNA-binding SARP family transcriptional activator/tetratricopeptide (TPR) repeat protein/TolB-like protein
MLRDNRFRLITLGRLTLVGAGGDEDASLARRRLKLAVLSVLALARRPVSRDTLLGLFWAEHDESRARHSLSNALSSLRGALGERSITTRDADVALDPETPLDVDAIEFSDAIERKDFERAVSLYEGAFLEGFHVDESPAFEQWISRERRRLESLFVKACGEHCATLARGRRWVECELVASRWLETEPLSGDAAIYYLNAIKSTGTRPALARALEEFEALRTRLHHEFELAPHPSVVELSVRIRDQLAAAPPEPVVDVRVTAETRIEPPPVAPATPPAPVASGEPAAPPRLTRTTNRGWITAASAVVVLVISVVAWLGSRDGSVPPQPVIAVLSMPIRSADSSVAWLSEGLPQMIDTKLANVPAVEVVPAARVRAVIMRSGRSSQEPLPDETARELARRVGASLVAHGALARDGQSFVLDLSVSNVASGELIRHVVLTHADPLMLADQAAARILAAANVSSSGPRLMDIETASLEAYQHYMRAQENAQAGRLEAAARDIDASIALDSGFIPALRWRLGAATNVNDTMSMRALRQQIQRHALRASEFDRMEQEVWDAYSGGEHERSTALARGLVKRYPRDPRAYSILESILKMHGDFDEAERVAIAGLSLDSMAMRAGTGPCAQCVGFSSIVSMRWLQGDYEGAAQWANRWIAEQPDAPSAWSTLGWTLAYAMKTDSALAVMQRTMALSGSELWTLEQYGRLLLLARRYAAVDSLITRIDSLYPRAARAEVTDLRSLVARERGQPRESMRVLESLLARDPAAGWFAELIRADNRRLLNEGDVAARMYESMSHADPRPVPVESGAVRAFCWHHALAADALGGKGDTVRLRAIADTLQTSCRRSYYGRDWRLHHHVRGLIAARGGRFDEAEREFGQAIWTTVEGWSRTTVELARARLALGRPREAITALRTAYATRLDAMGRYVPISELDFWMANAFADAGEPDSARVYKGYVDRAMANADPAVRARLEQELAALQEPARK